MSRKEEILSKVQSVPALPAAATEVIALIKDPDTDLKHIAKAIEHDPGLAANVLRLANSAYLGMPNSVDCVHNAIVRIGTREVSRMVIGSAIAPIVQQPVSGYNLASGALWEYSVAVAVATNELARLRNLIPPGEAFTAGLLHDIGKLVLGHFVEVDIDAIQKMAHEQQMSFEQAERAVLGVDHAEVGAALLDSWNLPPSIVQVVRWHHEPHNAPEEQSLVTDLVHASMQLVSLSGIGAGSDGTHYATSEETISRLDIRPALVEQALYNTMEAYNRVYSLFHPEAKRQSS